MTTDHIFYYIVNLLIFIKKEKQGHVVLLNTSIYTWRIRENINEINYIKFKLKSDCDSCLKDFISNVFLKNYISAFIYFLNSSHTKNQPVLQI